MKKLGGVEAARGIAAIMVVFYHAARHMRLDIGFLPLDGLFQFGHAGVDFFFVLSGFIIFLVHADDVGKPSRVKRYAERRFTRIFPFYWVILAATLLMVVALSSHPEYPSASKTVLNIFLLPDDDPVVGVAWTLQYEVLFYLAFGLAILHTTLGITVFSAWITLVIATMMGLLHPDEGTSIHVLTSTFNLEFLMGVATAATVRRIVIPFPHAILWTGVAGFVGIGALENWWRFDGYGETARLVYGSCAVLVICGLVELERQNRLSAPRILTELGRASYSIYLIHLLAIAIVYKVAGIFGFLDVLPANVTYVLLCLSAIIGGLIASRLIEYPIMAVCRSSLQRITGSAAHRREAGTS